MQGASVDDVLALCRLQNCRALVSELGLDNVVQFKVRDSMTVAMQCNIFNEMVSAMLPPDCGTLSQFGDTLFKMHCSAALWHTATATAEAHV